MWINLLSTAILIINEVMTSNVGTVMSPATNFDSWVELYNPSDTPVNLSGMYLSDTSTDLLKWQMPNNVGTVPAGGFLVVWLGSNDIKDTQAPFKLDCDGGNLYLTDRSGQFVTSISYPEGMSRTSYARKVDGGEEWGWTADVTPGASNATAQFATERLEPPVVPASRIFTGTMNFTVDIPEGTRLMYTTDGSTPEAPKNDEQSPWVEYITNGDCEDSDASCLISRDADGNGDEERIVDGAGVNGSRGIRVHAVSNPSNAWDAQFFVYTPGHTWQVGEKYRFSMMVRADKASVMTVQSHKTPHNYITYNMLANSYDVSTQWQEIVYEGVITSEQAGGSNGGWWGEAPNSEMQTIAFNLNEEKKENNFYFDNISWQSYVGTGSEESSRESRDGVFAVSTTANYTFRLFAEGKLPSVPVVRSYIQTSRNYTIPVISIVGDKRYFTDKTWGIDCDGTNGKTGNGQSSPKNYNMPWNRPVSFSYLSPEGEMLFSQEANISVSGGWTRSQSIRSFKLKSNKVFDGKNHFDYSFFPQKPYIRSKAILLRNGGNDLWEHNARFMDPALETVIQRSGIDLDLQSYVPVIEYVNGECRGVLNLREPNNDKFVYANWGYGDEEIDMCENFSFTNGNAQVLNRLFGLGANINSEGAYEEVCRLLDIDEFTNYMAVELFLGNDDWPDNNIKAYRSKDDGRFRFVSFDLDYAFALRYDTQNDNPFTFFASFSSMQFVNFFLNLLANDQYRRKFIDTYCLVAGSVFDRDRVSDIIDELASRVKPMHTLTNDGHSPESTVNTIKNQLKTRLSRMMTCLQNYSRMQLSGAVKQSVTLSSTVEGAHLFVNDVEVPYASFKGTLFAPVRLRALPPAGYRFEGWRKNGILLSQESEIALPNGSSLSLLATFTPLSDDELAANGITPVRVNELSAANDIYVNEYWKRNDWVELYNTTSEPIDVEGMFLTNDPANPQMFRIVKSESQISTLVPAQGYLIVWCDKLPGQSQLHAPFKLSASGGTVMLTAADGSWSDSMTYSAMKGNETIGRYPDGAGDVFVMNVPTIERANLMTSYLTVVKQPEVSGIHDLTASSDPLSVRFVVDRLVVRGAPAADVSITVYAANGLVVYEHTASFTTGECEIPVNGLPQGVCIARVHDSTGQVSSCKFVVSR